MPAKLNRAYLTGQAPRRRNLTEHLAFGCEIIARSVLWPQKTQALAAAISFR